MANLSSSDITSVLDLPQLHTKPSSTRILACLARLAKGPSTFTGSHQSETSVFSEDGLPAYLTRFISSPLAWIKSDEEREEIWEAASQRLSERSGRMAMSSMSRSFRICDFGMWKDGKTPQHFSIQLNEPSLTNDNVGHKTWVGSFLMAKRLALVMPKHLPSILFPQKDQHSILSAESEGSSDIIYPSLPDSDIETQTMPLLMASPGESRHQRVPALAPPSQIRVLELGSGTGLTGMAAAALFRESTIVHLTDLSSIVSNLVKNVKLNGDLFREGNPTTGILDWSDLPTSVADTERYDCILAADSLYDPKHPGWLTDAMALYLKRDQSARIIVELPFREMDLPYHDLFRSAMISKGFQILEQGDEVGFDDWEGAWCTKVAVTCWWSVWGWTDERPHGNVQGNLAEEANDYRSH